MATGSGDGAAIPENPVVQIAAASVKIPPFWPKDPTLWFEQIEASFRLAKITQDETKFYHIIGNLDQTYLSSVRDIVVNPPAANKYQALKDKLIAENSESDTQRLTRLFQHIDLGDKKPSVLLREMKSLAGNNVIGTAMENLFYKRIPDTVKAILQASPGDLDAKAALADKIMEVVPQNIAQVSQQSHQPIDTQIEALRKEMHALFNKMNNQSRSRSRNRSETPQGRTRSTSYMKDDDICYYHHKFGDKAQKCCEPCKFSTSGN
jgi:cleavage and polyadenylation specificity factor subunit 1